MMLTIEGYVGVHENSPDWNDDRKANAERMLLAVNGLMAVAMERGITFPINPKTGSVVSGETFGGFRPQSCPIGAAHSAHKEARAVDLYDPHGAIDAWCMANVATLAQHGIYIEHPSATPGWSHWSDRAPGSGHVVFYP